MHELSVASSLAETLIEFAEARGISRIVEIRIGVGEWACIDPEQLRFCIEAIWGESVLEGASVVMEPVSAAVRCEHCSYEGSPKLWEDVLLAASYPTLECPNCGRSVTAVAGHECAIQSVKFIW